MSALLDTLLPDATPGRRRPPLEPVARPAAGRLSRVPFLAVLAALLGIGMGGLLLLNTALQAQAFELNRLNTEVRDLSYTEAGLRAALDEQGSTRNLTRRASDLGMRPRDNTAFLVLPDGKISGDPKPAGDDYPRAFLDRNPATVQQEERAKAAEQADKRIAAEEKARAQRRADVEREQAERARDQARRDGATDARGDRARGDEANNRGNSDDSRGGDR
ncbi:hypothetical protein [Naumannella huperziae]